MSRFVFTFNAFTFSLTRIANHQLIMSFTENLYPTYTWLDQLLVLLFKKTQEKKAHGIFKAVKTFCMTLTWWISVVTHLLKQIECTTPRVNHQVNWTLRNYDGNIDSSLVILYHSGIEY